MSVCQIIELSCYKYSCGYKYFLAFALTCDSDLLHSIQSLLFESPECPSSRQSHLPSLTPTHSSTLPCSVQSSLPPPPSSSRFSAHTPTHLLPLTVSRLCYSLTSVIYLYIFQKVSKNKFLFHFFHRIIDDLNFFSQVKYLGNHHHHQEQCRR